ncbi:MAG: YdcF family protein [Anaerolineae bacterium]|nr:YdcF family protein [Anaerolineae bacterium]
MISRYDAILIPGGGVREHGRLPVWVQRRLDRALEVEQGEMIITLSAGTVHRPPPLDGDGFPVFESVAAADYLVGAGMDPKRILVETCSYDTIGNAYFARVIHIEPRGFKRLLVITSAFHMLRTERIFCWVFGLDAPAGHYELGFDAVSDDGIDQDMLAARREKEQARLVQLEETRARIVTLRDLHRWLFQEHSAYATGARPSRASGKLLASY